MTEQLYDVIEKEIAPPHTERVMNTGMTKANAEAYIKIAVARRGVDTHFYFAKPEPSEVTIRRDRDEEWANR